MIFWLVTWEFAGEHAREHFRKENNVAAIINSRISDERVRELVENIYVNEIYNIQERMSYAINKKNNPYPARFDLIDGIPFGGRVTCGHNPFLYARKVNNLHVEMKESGEEIITWQERPLPNIKPLIK